MAAAGGTREAEGGRKEKEEEEEGEGLGRTATLPERLPQRFGLPPRRAALGLA